MSPSTVNYKFLRVFRSPDDQNDLPQGFVRLPASALKRARNAPYTQSIVIPKAVNERALSSARE
jgi:hypothetical protein